MAAACAWRDADGSVRFREVDDEDRHELIRAIHSAIQGRPGSGTGARPRGWVLRANQSRELYL